MKKSRDFGQPENKAKQSQLPAFGWKSETRWVGRNSPVCRVLITSVLPSFSLIFIKENV